MKVSEGEKEMKQKEISLLSEFLEAIERINSFYLANFIMNNPAAKPFVFRGICDSEYKLEPGINRKQKDRDGALKLEIENDMYLSWGTERGILKSFMQEASGSLSLPKDDYLQWAEYAQHYGVPTRFLDWTSNPLVALYFACRDSSKKEGIVWMLHRINYEALLRNNGNNKPEQTVKQIINESIKNAADFKYPIIYAPYFVDSRMSSQSSFFMAWGSEKKALEDILSEEKYWMDLPERDDGSCSYAEEQKSNVLFKFIVYASEKKTLLRELDLVGINERSLFPGLDGIGRYVEKKYHFDYDEAIDNF